MGDRLILISQMVAVIVLFILIIIQFNTIHTQSELLHANAKNFDMLNTFVKHHQSINHDDILLLKSRMDQVESDRDSDKKGISHTLSNSNQLKLDILNQKKEIAAEIKNLSALLAVSKETQIKTQSIDNAQDKTLTSIKDEETKLETGQQSNNKQIASSIVPEISQLKKIQAEHTTSIDSQAKYITSLQSFKSSQDQANKGDADSLKNADAKIKDLVANQVKIFDSEKTMAIKNTDQDTSINELQTKNSKVDSDYQAALKAHGESADLIKGLQNKQKLLSAAETTTNAQDKSQSGDIAILQKKQAELLSDNIQRLKDHEASDDLIKALQSQQKQLRAEQLATQAEDKSQAGDISSLKKGQEANLASAKTKETDLQKQISDNKADIESLKVGKKK